MSDCANVSPVRDGAEGRGHLPDSPGGCLPSGQGRPGSGRPAKLPASQRTSPPLPQVGPGCHFARFGQQPATCGGNSDGPARGESWLGLGSLVLLGGDRCGERASGAIPGELPPLERVGACGPGRRPAGRRDVSAPRTGGVARQRSACLTQKPHRAGWDPGASTRSCAGC